MRTFLLVCLLAGLSSSVNQETFRGRVNPAGAQVAENLMRDMIRRVNDLIKQYTKLNNMNIGPVVVEHFSVRTLDTANVNLIMTNNKLGVRLNNGRVHLTANLAVYIPVFIGQIRVAGQFDTYGDNINAHLDSALGVSGGHLYSRGMGCSLSVGSPRVDLHLPIINHFANMILQGVMPSVTQAVCNGVKKYGNGMVNSVFQAIPTNIKVFDLFRLDFPVRNFRSWNRHMVAGVGMEVRPVNNVAVSNAGLRILALPEAEDSHMACVAVSDFVINTVSRTFLPVGKSFSLEVSSILRLFFGSLFSDKMFVQGTLTQSPMFLAEPNDLVFTVAASGRVLDVNGEVVPGTETEPCKVTVTAPNNEDPMFSNVKIKVEGPLEIDVDLDLSFVVDMLLGFIDKAFGKSRGEELVKRASNADIQRVLNEMFFSRIFNGFSLALSTRNGAVMACVSGTPTSYATNKIYGALRNSFRG